VCVRTDVMRERLDLVDTAALRHHQQRHHRPWAVLHLPPPAGRVRSSASSVCRTGSRVMRAHRSPPGTARAAGLACRVSILGRRDRNAGCASEIDASLRPESRERSKCCGGGGGNEHGRTECKCMHGLAGREK
jgi:hypothetical protein